MLNRRQLIQRGGIAAAALTIPLSFSLEGCSTESITNAINVVLSSALAIIKVAEPGASWLGSLASGIAALQQAEAQWQAGGPVALIDDALNTISAVLAVIPVTAVYAPLVAILVAGIEACLALIPQPAPTTTVTPAIQARAKRAQSPYFGMASLNRPNRFETPQGAYKRQFNAEATALNLRAATI